MSGHYFDSSPDVADRRSKVTVRAWGAERDYTTSTGVFSADRLDKATAILFEELDPPAAGTQVLDLGCGWGAIACTLAAAGAEVWAVDVNERALDLTALNAESHGLQVHTVGPDQVPDDLLFDEIWSNPPIRIGKQALHELLEHWLDRLRPGGVAHLVVGKNLGADSLQSWLIAQGFATSRTASAKGFRVLSVSSRRG